MIFTPDTVDPFCVSVNLIGTAAAPPNVPDQVPLNGPEDDGAEGLVGEDEPPPHAKEAAAFEANMVSTTTAASRDGRVIRSPWYCNERVAAARTAVKKAKNEKLFIGPSNMAHLGNALNRQHRATPRIGQ